MATLFSISAPIYEGAKSGERTELAVAIAVSGTGLTVDNTQGFVADDYIILGSLGTETCEIVKITSVTNDTEMVIGAVKFAHVISDSVQKTLFNQIRFYQSSTATGNYTLDGTESMEVDNADLTTFYSTTLASARSLFWKITYFNSNNSNETSQDDSEPVQPSAETIYCTVAEVGNFLGMDISNSARPLYGDAIETIQAVTSMIDKLTNRNYKEVTYTDYLDGNSSVMDPYFFVKHAPISSITTVKTTQNEEGVSTPTYNTLTENEDYAIDLETGRIKIMDDTFLPPRERARGMEVVYVGGSSTVPNDVRRLAVLMSSRQMMLGTHARDIVAGRQGRETPDLQGLDKEIDMLVEVNRRVHSGHN